MVPPRLEAEDVRVPELVTLPDILLLLLNVPEEILTLPVIPLLLVNVPSETETLAVIPEPLLLNVPEEETELCVMLPELVKAPEADKEPEPVILPVLVPEATERALLFWREPEVRVKEF